MNTFYTALVLALMIVISYSLLLYKNYLLHGEATRVIEIYKKRAELIKETKWRNGDKILYISGEKENDMIDLTKSVLKEIEELSNKKIRISDVKNDANLFLIFSLDNHKSMNEFFREFHTEKYGNNIFNKIGEQPPNFHYKSTNPCFFIGTKSLDGKKSENHNEIEFGFISIGNIQGKNTMSILHCLREELAHAVFLIPDFEVKHGKESIFNSNLVKNSTEEYSRLDKALIKAIYEIEHGLIDELSHEYLIKILKE